MNINFTENTEAVKVPEKVDDFLLSLFKSLDRQKSKDDRKSVEKKVIISKYYLELLRYKLQVLVLDYKNLRFENTFNFIIYFLSLLASVWIIF